MRSEEQYDHDFPGQERFNPQDQQHPESSKFVVMTLLAVTLCVIMPIVVGVLILSESLQNNADGYVDRIDAHVVEIEEQVLMITTKQPSEKSYGWQIEITSISGTISLEDAKFQVMDSEGIMVYSVTIYDANPTAFIKGSARVYTMTKGACVTVFNSTTPVIGTTALSDYSGCCIAYVDQTGDGKINGGDSLYVYKDYDADGNNEVYPNYEVTIMYGNDMAMNKVL